MRDLDLVTVRPYIQLGCGQGHYAWPHLKPCQPEHPPCCYCCCCCCCCHFCCLLRRRSYPFVCSPVHSTWRSAHTVSRCSQPIVSCVNRARFPPGKWLCQTLSGVCLLDLWPAVLTFTVPSQSRLSRSCLSQCAEMLTLHMGAFEDVSLPFLSPLAVEDDIYLCE